MRARAHTHQREGDDTFIRSCGLMSTLETGDPHLHAFDYLLLVFLSGLPTFAPENAQRLGFTTRCCSHTDVSRDVPQLFPRYGPATNKLRRQMNPFGL